MPFNNNLSLSCTTAPVNIDTFYPTTSQQVTNIILKMKNKYSRELYDIPIKLLKIAHETLRTPLAQFIHTSIKLGKFPDTLKIGKIISLHKKGTIENYLSFLSATCIKSL